MRNHCIDNKRLSFTITFSLVLVIVLGAVTSSQAAPLRLLEDDFNDNIIDAAKWSVVTAGIPQNPKSITEQNQQLEIEGRAHLNTASQFDPGNAAVGGLRISGQWEFVTADDFLQIVTRSDGIPSGAYGETSNGVEFLAYGHNENVTITGRGGATVTGLSGNGTIPGDINAGDVFDFVITDDGLNVSITLTRVSNPAQFITVTATSSFDPAANLITFHNRETGRRSNLDNVVVESLTLEGTSPTIYYVKGGLAMLALALLGGRLLSRVEK